MQRVMVVPGNRALTSAEVTLGPNDSVTVTATGRVYFSAGKVQSGAGASGWPRGNYNPDWPDDRNDRDDNVMNAGPRRAHRRGKRREVLRGAEPHFFGPLHNTGQFNVSFTVRRNAALHQ